MFDDPKKELEKLQQQLLEEEVWFQRELESAKAMIGDTPVRRNAAPQRPVQRVQQSSRSQPVQTQNRQPVYDQVEPAPKKKGIRGLVILALLETLGIVAIAAYWLLYLL